MTRQIGEKSLPVGFYVLAISLLLLTILSCVVWPDDDEVITIGEAAERRGVLATASNVAAQKTAVEAATLIVEVETYEARATSEAEATATAEASGTSGEEAPAPPRGGRHLFVTPG